MSKHVAAV